MEPRDLELLANKDIPESIRSKIAEHILGVSDRQSQLELETQRLAFERQRFLWNTPLVAAVAGLVTLTGTFVFDRMTASDETKNTITLEEMRAEFHQSEARLKQELEIASSERLAKLQSDAREREFQYEIVRNELEKSGKTNAERAAVLLFLVRAGVFTALNAEELAAMAREQKANPDVTIIPRLSSAIDSRLNRIVMHWTAGGHRASANDRMHYHEIVEGDGTRVCGHLPPEANISTSDGQYAAHTLALNKGSIGLAMAGMSDYKIGPFQAGPHPITVAQLEAFCALVADYARRYDIPITRETVLTHAEVERTLGVRQRGHLDIAWLPGMAQPGDPIEVGDRLREMIRAALRAPPLPVGQPGHCHLQAEAEPIAGDE